MRFDRGAAKEAIVILRTTTYVAAIFLCLSSANLAHCQETEIFVSPKGNDAHAGTKAQPFKSLEKARDAARKLKRDGKVVVWLREAQRE